MGKKKWKNPGSHTEYSGLYDSWKNMHRRAENKDGLNPSYSDVTVCKRWNSYDNFFEDMSSTWFPGATIDKDSICPGNKIYCPEYCKWMTKEENDRERWKRLGNPLKSQEAMNKYKSTMAPIWESRKGIPIGGKKVKCVETGEIFDSAFEAARKYNTPKCSVSRAANPNSNQQRAGRISLGIYLGV